MRGQRLAFVALAAASLTLVACDSSNDDDGGMMPPAGPDPTGELDVSGDFAMIAARGSTDDPYALDASALESDLATRFGGLNDEPLDIDDVEDAVTVANRGR